MIESIKSSMLFLVLVTAGRRWNYMMTQGSRADRNRGVGGSWMIPLLLFGFFICLFFSI